MIRRTLDILMTALSILLMGGPLAFENPAVHEWIGLGLILLWGLHNFWNRGFYKSLFRGKYAPLRIARSAVNALTLCTALLLAASGMMLSGHVFSFIDFGSVLGFARPAHLIASHWYFLLIAVHFSLHAGIVIGLFSEHPKLKKIFCIFCLVISLYGAYAFYANGLYRYLFYTQPFFFFDVECGLPRFFLDYISIFVLMATAFFWIFRALQKRPARG